MKRIPQTEAHARILLATYDAGSSITRERLAEYFRRLAVLATRGNPEAKRALNLLRDERRRRSAN